MKAVSRGGNAACRTVSDEQLSHGELVRDSIDLMMNLNSSLDEVRIAEWQSDAKQAKALS